MRELTRFELAACKRVAANTKSLRTKVEKLNAKIAELETMRDTYLSEIKIWESPIVEKYGYSVESILNGSYLNTPIKDVETECEYNEHDWCVAAENESYAAAYDTEDTIEVNNDEL